MLSIAYEGLAILIAAGRSESGELMVIATNANHITTHDRIEKLIAVMTIVFCWAHKIGEWRAEKKPILMKKFKNQSR